MAHPPGTSSRIQRLTSLVAVVLVGVAVGFAFGRVYLGHTATYQLLLVGIASGAVAAAFERRSLLLATVVSLVLLVVAIGWIVFPHTTWYGLPTAETLRAIARAAGRVGPQARYQVSPAIPTRPLLFAGITAVWAAVFSCHALAFRAGSPLLALVPPLALVVFADSVLEELTKPGYGLIFLGAALAVVFADSLRRMQGWGPVWNPPGRRNRLLPATGRAARRVAVFAVAFAAIAPAVVPGFGSHAVIDISRIGGGGDAITLSPLVSIGAVLKSGERKPVMRVSSPIQTFWRTTSLDHYDGVTWSEQDVTPVPVGSGQVFSPPPPAYTEPYDQTYTIANDDVRITTLPMGSYPNAVQLDGNDLFWDQRAGAVSTADPLSQGDTYTVTSSYPDPSAAQLRNAVLPVDPSFDRYTQHPDDLPPAILQIAERWAGSAGSPYDRVRAIQDHFLDLKYGFRYSTSVDYEDDEGAIVKFLQVKKGFCQQFASTMALMLRLLDIPSRVALGFTTGTPVKGQPDAYDVDTSDYHAWVEVYFDGYGWVPFDATPGIPNVAASSYQGARGGASGHERTDCPPRQSECSNTQSTTTSTSTEVIPPPTRPTSSPTGAAGSGAGRFPWPTAILVALGGLLVLGLAAIPAATAAQRRRRLRRAADEPRRLILTTYDLFTERAARLGLPRPPGDTPDEFRLRVEASGRLTDGHVERLTALAVRAAYGADEPSPGDAVNAAADADEAIKDLRDTTPWRRRLLGLYWRG